MQRRGIELPIRSKNAGKEPINKGTGKKCYCLNCGKDARNTTHKSNKCQHEYEYKQWVQQYKEAKSTKWG